MKTSSTPGPKTIVYYAVYHNCICVGVFNYDEFLRLMHSYFIFVSVFYLKIELCSKLVRFKRIEFQFPIRSDEIWVAFAIFRLIWYQTVFRLISNHSGDCRTNRVQIGLMWAVGDFCDFIRKPLGNFIDFHSNLRIVLYPDFWKNIISSTVRSNKLWFVFTMFRLIWYQMDCRLIPCHLGGCKYNHVPSSLAKPGTCFLNYLTNSSDLSVKLVYLTVYRKYFFRPVMFTYNLPVEFHCLMQLYFCFYNSNVISYEIVFPI